MVLPINLSITFCASKALIPSKTNMGKINIKGIQYHKHQICSIKQVGKAIDRSEFLQANQISQILEVWVAAPVQVLFIKFFTLCVFFADTVLAQF